MSEGYPIRNPKSPLTIAEKAKPTQTDIPSFKEIKAEARKKGNFFLREILEKGKVLYERSG